MFLFSIHMGVVFAHPCEDIADSFFLEEWCEVVSNDVVLRMTNHGPNYYTADVWHDFGGTDRSAHDYEECSFNSSWCCFYDQANNPPTLTAIVNNADDGDDEIQFKYFGESTIYDVYLPASGRCDSW